MKFSIFVVLPLMAGGLMAQRVTDTRNASIRGGGGAEGKCTIEVEVDAGADVEIQGSQARIRTLAGSPASFRRFECNQAMPMNPVGFRFQGIDGRGRQTLVRSADGSSPAIIRIEDSKGGREGYTFDIFWSGGSGNGGFGGNGNGGFGNGGFGNGGNGNGGFGNGNNGRGNNGNWGDGAWGDGNNRNNRGWSNDWDNDIDFRGRGDGSFRRNRGRTINLNDCTANISRNGQVTIFFDTNGQNDLRFTGQIERVENNVIFARLNGGGVAGVMQIRLRNRNRIQDVAMRGGNGRNSFDLQWRN